MKAVFCLPIATSAAPRWLHHALEVRALATITGHCPCGASYERKEMRPGEVYNPSMVHEANRPAADPRLEGAAVLPEWVELRAISLGLRDEAAA